MILKIIGHRGAKGLAAENTLAAFKAGLAAGVDEMECDARVTADSVPVVHHNATLNGKALSSLTLSELRQQKPDLATLEEVIHFVKRRVPLVIEVKRGENIAPIAALVQTFFDKGWRPSDCKLASFSQRTLRQLRQALPQAELVVIERWSGIRALHRARQVGAHYICLSSRRIAWLGVLDAVRGRRKLSIYTVNDPAQLAQWKKRGLYAIVTDYPDRFTHQQ